MGKYRPALFIDVLRGRENIGRAPPILGAARRVFPPGTLSDVTSGSSLPELIGIGDDNRGPARVDLEEDLDLQALVDRRLPARVLDG